MRMSTAGGLAALAILTATIWPGAATPAAAEEIVSQYTSADLKKCRKFGVVKIEDSEHAASWECKGLAGYVVLVSDDDARTTVSIGRSVKAAAKEPAASEGFPSFNSSHDTVEWRSLKGGQPFAVIQRWSVAHHDQAGEQKKDRQLLIVTRLPPGRVCQVAHVEAAHKDANLLARQAADQYARTFRCGKDKVRTIGGDDAGRAKS
jgi:hypothetical protein